MTAIKYALRETAPVILGVFLCAGATVGVYGALGAFRMPVLWGALWGALLASGNYFSIALSAFSASEKAMSQDVKGGAALMQGSYFMRMIVLFLLLVIGVKALNMDPLPSVIPIALLRPTITVIELFRKKGENAA